MRPSAMLSGVCWNLSLMLMRAPLACGSWLERTIRLRRKAVCRNLEINLQPELNLPSVASEHRLRNYARAGVGDARCRERRRIGETKISMVQQIENLGAKNCFRTFPYRKTFLE